ncbi:hypothetical protein AmDm5_1883 [Acetobacter malorum]|nr:hypothetical protein [Acetobacter malorum]KFL87881.1 hypothetical protein AmDm5_1883 [Acetobacter malorum]
MMKKSILALAALPLLAACSGNQVTLRKAALDTMSAYHLADTGAQAYLSTGKANDTVKADIKTASDAALAPLTALDTAVSSGDTLTNAEIATAESALASLQSALATGQTGATTTTTTSTGAN